MATISHSPGAPASPDVRTTIREALGRIRVFDDQVIELRALKVPMRYGKPATVAGWYDDLDRLAEDAVSLDQRKPFGVYVTLNLLNPALLCRGCNRLVEHVETTTSNDDISRLIWLPIDLDPVRPSGVSASSQEVETARVRAVEVSDWLTEQLDAPPDLFGFSGNGWHLLSRIDLPNDPDSVTFVKSVIVAAAKQFSDGSVSIDESVFNPARIWKLYGTTARKGDEVARLSRIHRQSRLIPRL